MSPEPVKDWKQMICQAREMSTDLCPEAPEKAFSAGRRPQRTARRLDGDNGQRAHIGPIREEHGGRGDDPRAPFIEGRLRCGAALVAALPIPSKMA